MHPDEVLSAAVLGGRALEDRIRVVDGYCSAVECVDVYMESADPFYPKPARYRIRATTELEYFLPERNMPVRMAGPSELAVTLPPYCARGWLYLGRAISLKRAEFSVEAE